MAKGVTRHGCMKASWRSKHRLLSHVLTRTSKTVRPGRVAGESTVVCPLLQRLRVHYC